MSPYGRALLVFIAAVAIACGGGGDDGGSPTSPSGGGSTASCTRPSAPTGLTAAVSGNGVLFTWSAVSGAIDYQVLVGTQPSSSDALSTNTTQTNYAWNGISRGTYYVRVDARNTCGSGSPSSQVTFTIS